LLVSTSNLAGGNGDAATIQSGDATTNGDGGGAGKDGSSSSSGGGGGDGGAADGAALSFCKSPGASHLYCEDFDDDGDGGAPWWVPNGQPTRTTQRSKSAPSSLLGKLDQRPSNGPKAYASIMTQLVGPWRHIVVDFDVWFEPPQWQPTSS